MTTSREGLGLLAEADLFLMLAKLASGDARGLEGLRTLALSGDELLKYLDYSDPAVIRARLQALAAAAIGRAGPWLETEYTRLHDGATICPINETAFVRRDKGQILADLAGFYRAFGLVLAAQRAEKHDHVATELEFLAMMLVLEAQARSSGLSAELETTRKAIASFVEDHLGVFLPSFTRQLAATTNSPFHFELAGAIDVVWEEFLARRGIATEAGAEASGGTGEEPGGPSFECGGCAPEQHPITKGLRAPRADLP